MLCGLVVKGFFVFTSEGFLCFYLWEVTFIHFLLCTYTVVFIGDPS